MPPAPCTAYASSMTAPPQIAPSPGRARDWTIAVVQSLVSVALGTLILLVAVGIYLEEFDDDPPTLLLAMRGIDAVVGLPCALAIGPLRFLRPGALRTTLLLLITAISGFSAMCFAPGLIALFRLGTERRRALDIAAVGIFTLVTMASQFQEVHAYDATVGRGDWVAVGVFALTSLVPLLAGRVIGTRTALLASWHEQAEVERRGREAAERAQQAAQREAEALRREQDATVALARAQERSALARDVHDSVSHHLAAIAMHAGAMGFREDLPPAELRRIAGTVRDAAQEANRELREVLTALRAESGASSTLPLPTAPTAEEVLEQARMRGQQVELTLRGTTSAQLAAELEQRSRSMVVALTRILTEVLANAAKHAPGEPVDLTLERTEDMLRVLARNPMPADPPRPAAPSTGFGLVGLQERARLRGGDARFGPRGGSGDADVFEVEAWLPW